MAEYIECRRCDSPNCDGCNNLLLVQMFHKGKFDCLLDEYLSISPAADVEVVKHGRWIYKPYEKDEAVWLYHCSECNALSALVWNYCRECGAKMDLEG